MKNLSKIISLLGLIFSVVLFFTSMKLNFFGENTELDPLIRSTLIFIISLMFSETISRIIAKNELDEHLESVKSVISDTIDCRSLGNTQDALGYIMNNLPKLKYVENTHVKVGDHTQDAIYNGTFYNKYLTSLKRQVEKGLVWNDIIGESSVYRKKQIIEWVTEKPQNRRLYTKVIPNTMPIINHITLKYKDGSEETLFGWASRMDKPMVEVFATNNENIIRFFKEYFDDLGKHDISKNKKQNNNG